MDQSTRPRRPSLTQHLQRILHIDGHGNSRLKTSAPVDSWKQRHHSSSQVSPDAGLTASPQQQQFIQQRAHKPQGYLDVNENLSHTHTRNHTSYSYTSLGSRLTPLNGEHPERISNSSAHEACLQKSQASCAPEETPTKSDICASPTWTSNSPLRNERRATLRLEAERVELEKKLMKIEQMEATKDSSPMRREPRRLTKKQPFGSSSRASSVSADEPRASRRISSFFSSSRHSSRSRSSSLNEDDKGAPRPQSLGPGGTPKSDPSTQSATRTLSTTLPERLGTAISKELAVQSNPLLADHTPCLRSQKLSHSEVAMAVGQGTESNKSFDKIEASTSHVQGFSKLRQEPTEQIAPIPMSISHVQQVSDPSELDRSSFAAALNLRKRISSKVQSHGRLSQPTHSQSNTTQEENHCELDANDPSKKTSSVIPLSANRPGVRKSMVAFQSGSSRSIPSRTLRGKIQGRHKGFTSSPLAGFPTRNDTASQPLDAVPTEQASASFDGLCHTEPSAISKITASSNTNALHPMTSLQLSNEDGREDRHFPSSPLDFTSIAKESPRTRLLNISGLSDHSPKPHSSPAIPHTKPKGLPPLKQGVQHAFGPVKTHEYGSRGHVLENHSQSRSARSRSQEWSLAAQKRLEGESISICPCDSNSSDRGKHSPPKGGSTNALDYRIGHSTVSLSASLSQDSESEEYNTADEAAPSASKSQSEESIPVKQLNIASVPASLGASANKISPSKLHHTSQAVHPNTSAHWTEQVGENPKHFRRGQLVAKLFVICCHCESWHDLPSEMYAKLAFPANPAPANHGSASLVGRSGLNDRALSEAQVGAVSGSPIQLSVTEFSSPRHVSKSETVAQSSSPVISCCWCEHNMSRVCCQGWTTVVELRETSLN
ncbi:hypothetical protein F9C07_2109575 [Aspergillus flavus]|uniref:Uncharacterized protein n=3 Tax=Aspergillus subgen. Circumdati TaxID=2720871 RepID=A0A7U2R3L3_ASPFN|nr:hypothetical protein F9C07_2109575 [Aspergillus flavus]GMG38383.1 unnamed protein product [Aspergillus oryzae]GMG54495.1 unnamed protein product [Aspergillus oryzae var. brunneus]